MKQNCEVFAIPGAADRMASRGCHRLIRDGARLVERVEDILGRGLSPFLDWVQREVAALQDDIMTQLCGGEATRQTQSQAMR